MKCPYCGELDSKVIDSRPTEDGEKIRRRRECLSCAKRFTTVKRDRSREAFDRQKLLGGMLRASEKREVSYQTLEAAVDRIEQTLLNSYEREVTSMHIGELAMDELKNIPHIEEINHRGIFTGVPPKHTATFQERTARQNKVLPSLEDAIRATGLKDGMTISFHHHFRGGDHVINQVVDTLQNISCGVLRGYNDTRIISLVCLVSYGFIGLGGGYLLGRTDVLVPALGAAGFWYGYIISLSVCAVCYMARVHYLHGLDMDTVRERLAK